MEFEKLFSIFKRIQKKIMGQSLSQLYVHLTFGTYDRYPFIKEYWERGMHGFMAGILKKMKSPALEINSVEDHSHVLFRLSKNYALITVIEQVKKESSKWVKDNTTVQQFAWQGGYGAFSVSSSKLETVRRYIQNQKEHHKKMTYQEEVEKFLKEYNVIGYNENYFWR